jgi:hypothetical protein
MQARDDKPPLEAYAFRRTERRWQGACERAGAFATPRLRPGERGSYAATVGWMDNNSIFLGEYSGRHGLRRVLEDMGHTVEGRALDRAFARFKESADEKQALTRADLEAPLDPVEPDVAHNRAPASGPRPPRASSVAVPNNKTRSDAP